MKLLVTIVVILRCYVSTDSVGDHYWRDYNGLIPSDALPSTNHEDEDVIYIGQFSVVAEYHEDVGNIHTLVATINKGERRAIAAYNGRTVYSNETSNLKVLCASSNYRYSWKNKNSIFPPNCRFVVGGDEDSVPLYIGRATKGKTFVIGGLFSDISFHDGKLTVPHQGGEEKYDTYEVLTHCS